MQLMTRGGNLADNQFRIIFEHGMVFQSYGSIILIKFRLNHETILGPHWDYSNTTRQYRSIFVSGNTKVIQGRIDSGEYKYDEEL